MVRPLRGVCSEDEEHFLWDCNGLGSLKESLPKVGPHALYTLISVLFANLCSSQGKGL